MCNTFESWTNDDLLRELRSVIADNQRTTAQILVYLLEVESRRLHLDAGPSLLDFCIHELGMSDDQARRRLSAAAVLKQFPMLLPFLERGDMHLTNLLALRPYLTESNHEELATAASRLTKLALERLIAERFPRRDVPSSIQQIHEPIAPTAATQSDSLFRTTSADATATQQPSFGNRSTTSIPNDSSPEIAASMHHKTWQIEQLSGTRFRMEFTADQGLRDQIVRAMNLLAHRNPTNDLAKAMQYAFDLAIASLEKQRLGKTSRGKRTPITSQLTAKRSNSGSNSDDNVGSVTHAPVEGEASGKRVRDEEDDASNDKAIPREVRRAVFERDGEQCAFVGEAGKRCPSRSALELDHIVPRAHGGTNDLPNIRVVCRAHNFNFAVSAFGQEHIEKAIQTARTNRERAKSESPSPPIAKSESLRCVTESAHSSATLPVTPIPTRASHEDENAMFETVASALAKMGYSVKDARYAVSQVRELEDPATQRLALKERIIAVICSSLTVLT